MTTERVRLARIALGHLAEPGSRELGELVRSDGPVGAVERLVAGDVPDRLRESVEARLETSATGRIDPWLVAEAALDRADRLGARILTPEDDEWPRRLNDLTRISREASDRVRRDTYPPHCVWVRGPWRLDEACERSVAVVGARASTSYGQHVATELAYQLADRGWAVVSGGAFGIDAAAHRAALAAEGVTVAILACGIDRPYPASHTSLFDRIADEGLLLSEWPPGADPHRHRFLIRNRVIAAISRGTVVVEANVRSGARYTLRKARLLGRAAMAVPGPVTSAMSAGCHEELRETGSLLVTGAPHVIDAVGLIGDDLAQPLRAPQADRDRLSPLENQILDGVRSRRPQTAEQVAATVGVSAREARRVLPGLVLLGYVVENATGYRLAPAKRGGVSA